MAAKAMWTECRVGEILSGRWHLDRLLGTGGMARVFAATHRNTHRVAIKVLKAELASDRELCARFLREGYVCNRVEHRATVRVLDDDFTDAGIPYLVMELLEGETLVTRLGRTGCLPSDEVLLVAEEVLSMLTVAHRRGVVHRDLKPENMFVTRKGYLKVLDFGLARVREGPRPRVNSVRFGAVLGTPAYMAPEQARGDWKAVDERTDLWALGATLFTLATGRYVHEGPTTQVQLVAAVTKPAPRVRERCPSVPRALAEIIDRALAYDPSQRWQNAQAMLQAVREAEGIPPSRPSLQPLVPIPSVFEARTESGLVTWTMPEPRRRPLGSAWRRLVRLASATLWAALRLFKPERRLQH